MLAEFISVLWGDAVARTRPVETTLDFVVWHQFNTDPKGDPLLYGEIGPGRHLRETKQAGGADIRGLTINLPASHRPEATVTNKVGGAADGVH
ncbi:MAG: hypothetical protein M3Z35_02380 [Nitrospirota bacterium]|nr:hypothetical protein [Nitrospirota bacterium]